MSSGAPSGLVDVHPDAEAPFSLLGRRVPAGMDVRLVELAPRSERAYVSAEWQDGLVVVEEGAIVLVGRCGRRRPLPGGAVLWLEGLPLSAIANPHPGRALLSVLSRERRRGSPAAPRPA